MNKFTIDQFRNYILSKDSMGDILYYLSEEAVQAADDAVHQRETVEEEEEIED